MKETNLCSKPNHFDRKMQKTRKEIGSTGVIKRQAHPVSDLIINEYAWMIDVSSKMNNMRGRIKKTASTDV